MGTPIVVLGSVSSHGGSMITASAPNILSEGIPTCLSGDLHTCPIPYHGVTSVFSGVPVLGNGIPVLQVGDVAGCGAVIVQGIPNVLIG